MVVAVAVEANSVERFGQSDARERDKLVFRKTIPAAHIEYKEGNCSKESNFFLYCAGARTGLL